MKEELMKKTYRSLSIYEENALLPILINGLQTKKGKMNAVTAKQIVSALRKHGVKIGRTSLHLLINHIRTNDLIAGLMASPSGYYISNCEQELLDYENGLMKREAEIRKVRMCMKRQRKLLSSQKKAQLPKQTQLF